MPVAVVADSHLGGPGGDASLLIAQLKKVAETGCQRLILLGDIFHVWVGFKAFETPEVAAVMEALEEIRKSGLRVDYIEGNRDFFLEEGPYGRFLDEVTLETSFEAGGRRYLVVHGDGLNDRDRKYRFWRWLSKSALSRLMVRCIPAALARRIVRSTDERLSRTNFKHKAQIPETVIRAYAERRLAEGFDTLLLGHFHEARHWQVKGGEVILLEAWFKTRQVEWFGGEGHALPGDSASPKDSASPRDSVLPDDQPSSGADSAGPRIPS